MAPLARTRASSKTDPSKPLHARATSSSMKLLPTDIMVDIFARVASSSFTDLHSVRLCCKEFHEATENDYIFEHLAIPRDKISVIQWLEHEKVALFLKRCRERGNAEALYREGLVDYCSRLKRDAGFDNIRRAAKKGHPEACYVLGVILTYTTKGKSVEVLKQLHDDIKKSKANILRLKRQVREIIRKMWVNNRMEEGDETSYCIKFQLSRKGWPEDEEDMRDVGPCTWECEVRSFRDMLRGS